MQHGQSALHGGYRVKRLHLKNKEIASLMASSASIFPAVSFFIEVEDEKEVGVEREGARTGSRGPGGEGRGEQMN